MPAKHQYNEDKIKTISSLEHIRARPGMYIGRMGDGSNPADGIYVLLKETIDNSVDEFIMGAGKRIDVSIDGEEVIVRDFGRGIPLGKVIDCVSVINTGGKFNDDVFQFSVGLNGVGTKAVNALSEKFLIQSFRDGKYFQAYFERGELVEKDEGETQEKDGTRVVFTPDKEMFPPFSFDMEYIRKRLWMYAYLNRGLSLYLNGERFYSRNGLKDFLDAEVGEEKLYDTIYYKDETLEFAFNHIARSYYGENYYSFVNGQYTNDGGTHLSAFREGILKGINNYAGTYYNGSDVRDGIVGSISVKLKEPVFESQTKNKLGNTDIRSWIVGLVKDAVSHNLYKNQEMADAILDKISRNKKLRLEIQAVKKESREKAKKVSLKIPKLKDCKYHLHDKKGKGKDSMIFLTEGQSAAGSMVNCRDIYTQAIYPLRGKPLNCYNQSFAKIYKNEELYYITQALNIEESVDNLRYNKVIIATDSDVDGLHIRNLLITFFLSFFEQLVSAGHLYLLETPLYRVRNKKETIYCYNETERNNALKKLGSKGVEVTRFKGLGEISPSEFSRFIRDDIRLINVTVDYTKDIPEILGFYMGKNTPERRDYIVENLV